jgi:hypothetical protein
VIECRRAATNRKFEQLSKAFSLFCPFFRNELYSAYASSTAPLVTFSNPRSMSFKLRDPSDLLPDDDEAVLR